VAIIFQKSGLSDLTLERGRVFPVTDTRIRPNQERYLTESLNPKVVVYGGTLQLLELRLEGLSRDNYDGAVNGLKTWFESSQVNWSANNFTLVDEQGQTRTVRLWSDEFKMTLVAPNRYSVSLLLLEE